MTQIRFVPIASLPPDANFVTVDWPRPQAVKACLLHTAWTVGNRLCVAALGALVDMVDPTVH